MQTALRIKMKIDSPGKIEILAPQLTLGEVVEVIILLPAQEGPPELPDQPTDQTTKRSVVDVLAETSGQRLFKTATEVKTYLQGERDEWEN